MPASIGLGAPGMEKEQKLPLPGTGEKLPLPRKGVKLALLGMNLNCQTGPCDVTAGQWRIDHGMLTAAETSVGWWSTLL